MEWWRQLGVDIAAVDRAIEREHQAAAAGTPWPPQHEPEPVLELENIPRSDPEAYAQLGPDEQTRKLDGLIAQAIEAAGRFTEQKADRQARAEYAARLEREAYGEPERIIQTETSYEAEIEL